VSASRKSVGRSTAAAGNVRCVRTSSRSVSITRMPKPFAAIAPTRRPTRPVPIRGEPDAATKKVAQWMRPDADADAAPFTPIP